MNADARRFKKGCELLLPRHGRPVANVIARAPWESAQEEVMGWVDGVRAFSHGARAMALQRGALTPMVWKQKLARSALITVTFLRLCVFAVAF